jgi:hypothetical protein
MNNCYFCHRPVFTTARWGTQSEPQDHVLILSEPYKILDKRDFSDMDRGDLIKAIMEEQDKIQGAAAAHADCLTEALAWFNAPEESAPPSQKLQNSV